MRTGGHKKNSKMEINKNNIKKILVIMLGGIGNLILLTPALKALRQAFLNQEIILLTSEPKVEEIIKSEGLIDGVRCLDIKMCNLAQTLGFIQSLRKEKFDLTISSAGTNSFKAGLLALLIGAKYRIGENINNLGIFYNIKVPFKLTENELDASLRIVSAIAVKAENRNISLTINKEELDFVGIFLDNNKVKENDLIIGMHSGVGLKLREFRKWPKERFAELADILIEKYKAKIVLTGSANEKVLTAEIATLMKNPVIQAAGEMNIKHTSALVKRCRLFISNDSGIAHVAAGVGTPLIVFFGPTNENKTAPQGKNVIVLKKGTLNKKDYLHSINLISVEDALKAAESQLSKI